MSELIHTSRVRIFQDKPPYRRAYIENFAEPVPYGVHGGIKHFYKMSRRRTCRRRSITWSQPSAVD